MFLLGILQVYFLLTINSYYNQLQINLINKISNPNKTYKIENENIMKNINLVTNLFIIIGVLTPLWYVYSLLIVILSLGSIFDIKEDILNSPPKLNNTKGDQIISYIKRSKVISYISLGVKVISMVGIGIMYFHGYISF